MKEDTMPNRPPEEIRIMEWCMLTALHESDSPLSHDETIRGMWRILEEAVRGMREVPAGIAFKE